MKKLVTVKLEMVVTIPEGDSIEMQDLLNNLPRYEKHVGLFDVSHELVADTITPTMLAGNENLVHCGPVIHAKNPTTDGRSIQLL